MDRKEQYVTRTISRERAALVVAHPGHELSLVAWLERMQPSVFVITDGSGQLARSRLHSTTKVLLRAGARPGSIYGHLTDGEAYAAMLGHDVDLFLRMAFELADWIFLGGIDYVVGDAAEGYNPMHDVCRIVVGGAVELGSRLAGRPIGNYEYVVTGSRAECVAGRCRGAIRLELDDEALTRKLAAAHGYPELAGEVEAAIRRDGIEAFRYECLHPVDNRKHWSPPRHARPYYEEHGEGRVAAGKYRHLVRYAEHVAPLRAAFWDALNKVLDAREMSSNPAAEVR
ncbi:MAG TPA: hypothetical protein VMI34_20455 [Candidatus Bathyarchaeia archaeon]|nr:hypothetical protein [Candidatus Bathyarchaeia archaeon]